MATRNTGASIKGEDKANPTAFLMAGVKLLEYNNLYKHANLIRDAIAQTITNDGIRTEDLGGVDKTGDFMKSFSDNLGDLHYAMLEAEQ